MDLTGRSGSAEDRPPPHRLRVRDAGLRRAHLLGPRTSEAPVPEGPERVGPCVVLGFRSELGRAREQANRRGLECGYVVADAGAFDPLPKRTPAIPHTPEPAGRFGDSAPDVQCADDFDYGGKLEPDLEDIYELSLGDYQGVQRSSLHETTLAAWNVDARRLLWAELYSRGKLLADEDHMAQLCADTKSGILQILELKRDEDSTPKETQFHISEIMWQVYQRLALRQQQPLSKLRIIWFDTVMNEPTKEIV
ncbi:hypothetical protein F5B19DRAFT_489874 [Rostrohypoxylon terebratum]|nr:hypothetical protein F5B19DRAFT_489874 [Rostrohypoxylon terebratum]